MDIQAYYAALADFIVAFHTLFVGFVVVGQLLIMIGLVCRWRWVRNPWFRVDPPALHRRRGRRGRLRRHLSADDLGARPPRLAGQTVNDSAVGWFFNSILFFNMPREFFTWIHIGFGALVLATFLIGFPRFPARWPTWSPSQAWVSFRPYCRRLVSPNGTGGGVARVIRGPLAPRAASDSRASPAISSEVAVDSAKDICYRSLRVRTASEHVEGVS